LIGLTNLRNSGAPLMTPKLNRRRALLVLGRIDEILSWERITEQERDTRFVELGRYLCEVRAGQYWRVDNLKSFDEFLEKKFPESRRKAYYLMAIHEQLPRQTHRDLKQVGWTKAAELAKVAHRDGQTFDCATWLHKARELPKEEFKREVERHLTGQDAEPWEMLYFKVYKSDRCPHSLLSTARRVTGVPIRTRIEGPRPGDPARLVADPSRAKALLKWQPTMSELDAIVESAWAWKKRQPNGYGSRAVAK